MLLESQETLSCDVLVIGGGGAGLRSAIAAGLNNADVLLVSKSRIGHATNTYISKAVIAASGWGTPDDNENVHTVDTVKGGRFLNDQSMVANMAERAHSEITFLKDCGVDFDMNHDKHRVIRIAGHRYPRHVYGTNWRGSDLVLPLKRRAESLGVRFAEHVFVTRLIATEDRICGIVGITTDGRFIAIHAKSVVLATGGYAQIYFNTNNASGITGDGQALAYDLGIPLKDMEFVQFYPTATGKRGISLILYEKMFGQRVAVLRDWQGEDILHRHGITDPTKVTRDRLAQLIFNEIRQGTPPNQGVFMDMSALTEKTARQMSPILPPGWWKGQKTFKVTPTAHFCMGGIVTDPHGETRVKGLFAVGEAAAGVHGANRLGGNALAEIFAMGSWVGEKAAERIRDSRTAVIPGNALKKERSRLEGAFSNQGVSTKQLILELKQLMWDKAGVIRGENGLGEALEHLRKPFPRVTVLNPTDLIRRLAFQNMRCVAKMVCRSALERTESRGSHFRTDCPGEDNLRWLKNIVLRKSEAGMSVEAKPVNLDLVALDA